MDILAVHPFLKQMGGAERVCLEIAKRFNTPIYCVDYDAENTFPEFKEFEINILPEHKLEAPFSILKDDARRHTAVSAGMRYYFHKFKQDYDAICAQGCPSEWIRNKNERVCLYSHSPNRQCYDLYEWRMAKLNRRKRIVTGTFCEVFKAIENGIIPKIETICTNSEVTNERIRKYWKREDAEVIHPAVDADEFMCESYEKFFLYPSRFVPEKRFESVIKAFRMFVQKSKRKDFKLVFAGYAHNIEYLHELKDLASGLPVEFVVNAPAEKLKKLYATCYATLFYGINEDWGLIPLESMASEKPCIAVNEGGMKYSIVDDETGFLVNTEELMAVRMWQLSECPDKVEEMGKAGRKRVLEKYTWKIFGDKLENQLKKASRRKCGEIL